LPFRLQVTGGTWLELVRRTFEAEWEMLPYRRYPLIALQRKWNSQPLFETQFNYVHFHALEGVLHSGEVEILPSGVKGIEETHFTLEADFGLDTISSRLYLTTKGDVTQLSIEQVEAAAAYYAETLREMAADPLAHHETGSILSTREREQLLFDWNQTHSLYPQENCLHELFEQQAERTPDSVAVIFEDRQLSYRELNQRANQAAHYLRGMGVECETRVALLMERSLEMLVGLLAIQKAGAAYVPLDPAYPHERLTFMLEDAQVEVLLTQKQLSHHLPATVARVIALDADWDLISAESIENPASGAGPENLAYVIYTSGSTGRPKGAMLPHRGIVNCIWGMQGIYKLTEHDRTLFKTPLSFDASVWELFWPLMVGASVVIARPGGHRDTAYLLQTIIEHAVTTVYFVPSLLTVFLDEKMLAEAACVRYVICGGESLAIETVERFYSRLNAELHHSYGPTETSIASTEWTCERASQRQSIPIGRPLANTQIYLLDRNMQLLPVGTPGEMYIGGDGLARGYLNRPELSAERFVPNPFSTEAGARLYRTGDLTRYLPDGTIEFLGRLDHQVKVRGLRIELGEIEAVLGAHPAIKEAVVMAREDRRGDKRLVAYGRAESSELPTHSEMVNYLREKLPDYMIPAIFVWLEAWPLMTNGKVDRKRLPVPDEARPELEIAYVAPRTEIERVIAAIWQEVLQVEKVGMHDNFFDLGGHSLRLLQVNGKLGEALNRDLSIVELFQYPTVSALAVYLSQEQEPDKPSAGQDKQERSASRKRLAEQQRQVRKSHRATK
jgi:amino acid adenylation domain-containing protein